VRWGSSREAASQGPKLPCFAGPELASLEGGAAHIVLQTSILDVQCLGRCEWQLVRPALGNSTTYQQSSAQGDDKGTEVSTNEPRQVGALVASGRLVRGASAIRVPELMEAPLHVILTCKVTPGLTCQPVPSRLLVHKHMHQRHTPDQDETVAEDHGNSAQVPQHMVLHDIVPVVEVLVHGSNPHADPAATVRDISDLESLLDPEAFQPANRATAEVGRKDASIYYKRIRKLQSSCHPWAGRLGLAAWIIGLGVVRYMATILLNY